jgi:hypothetical protein
MPGLPEAVPVGFIHGGESRKLEVTSVRSELDSDLEQPLNFESKYLP